MSAESGIPTYRGTGGQWTRFGEPSMLSFQEFARDPAAWWQRRLIDEQTPGNAVFELKEAAEAAEPNEGHYALVEMERSGALKRTMTQNVDNLHRRAGSVKLTEIHGNRTLLRCLECCYRVPRTHHPVDEFPPHCPKCHGVLKLDTVMFGESIPQDVLEACRELIQNCDCMLLIGTSGTVKPAAQFPVLAKERGATLIEINLERTHLTDICHQSLWGSSGELLPALVEALVQRGADSNPRSQ